MFFLSQKWKKVLTEVTFISHDLYPLLMFWPVRCQFDIILLYGRRFIVFCCCRIVCSCLTCVFPTAWHNHWIGSHLCDTPNALQTCLFDLQFAPCIRCNYTFWTGRTCGTGLRTIQNWPVPTPLPLYRFIYIFDYVCTFTNFQFLNKQFLWWSWYK